MCIVMWNSLCKSIMQIDPFNIIAIEIDFFISLFLYFLYFFIYEFVGKFVTINCSFFQYFF